MALTDRYDVARGRGGDGHPPRPRTGRKAEGPRCLGPTSRPTNDGKSDEADAQSGRSPYQSDGEIGRREKLSAEE